MCRAMRKTGVLTLALSCLLTDVALAQEPAARAEADRQRREEKAAQTKAYEPKGVERAINFAETRGIFILDREGFYPKLGSLTVGSGFAYGLGFRNRRLFENTGALDLWASCTSGHGGRTPAARSRTGIRTCPASNGRETQAVAVRRADGTEGFAAVSMSIC